jgi:hypothetical protein
MAYKFQFGTTKLSGSTTFEEALVGESTISGSGRLSGKELILDAVGVIGTSGDADLLTLSQDKLTVAGDVSASLDLQGTKVVIKENGSLGIPSQVDLVTLSPNVVDVLGKVSSSLGITGSGLVINADESSAEEVKVFAGLVSGSTHSKLHRLTVDRLVAGTADINGGTVDGAAINDTTIGASTQSSGKFTTLSASSTVDIAGQARFGVDNQLTVSTAGVLSGSATATLANATLDQITVGSADINGGAIDGATVGATTQASGEFTTLSASSTLDVAGVSRFGPENLVQISAAGVISGSGDSTIHKISSNQLIFGSASLNGDLYINKLATSVDEIMGLNTGSLLYHDEATGKMKLGSFSSYALALAGTGITATDGVLSVDTTGGDSMSATHIPVASYGNATLTVGLNFMTSDATGSCSLLLPSASAGDVVIVKAPAGVTSTNFVKISSSVAQADEIDGFSEARIESPFGAVSLVYSNSDGKWVIY